MKHWTPTAALLLCALTAVAPVSAQDSAQEAVQGATNSAAAEGLYDQARTQLRAGETAKACALLEESQRLEHAVGTILLLAHCYEALGRTASAWALFQQVQSVSSDNEQRQQIARIRAAALESRLARLVIEYPPGHSPQLGEWTVQRDAALVQPASVGIAVPVDPGPHTVSVSGADIAPWSTTVEVPTGPTLVRVTLAPTQTNVAAAGLPTAPRMKSQRHAAHAVAQPSEETTSNVVPWVLTGLGAAGILAGVALTFTANQKYNESDPHCRTRTLCDSTGLGLRSSAESQAAWATGSSLLGAASLATAGLLFVFRTERGTAWHVQPHVHTQAAFVSIGGQL